MWQIQFQNKCTNLLTNYTISLKWALLGKSTSSQHRNSQHSAVLNTVGQWSLSWARWIQPATCNSASILTSLCRPVHVIFYQWNALSAGLYIIKSEPQIPNGDLMHISISHDCTWAISVGHSSFMYSPPSRQLYDINNMKTGQERIFCCVLPHFDSIWNIW
jgi:hypothetical protein